MSDDILKQLVLGDDLANEIGDFNFANLGFSLADFEVEEKAGKSVKKQEKKAEKAEEHLKYKNRLGKKKQLNSKEPILTVSNLIKPDNENLEISNDELSKKDNYSPNKNLNALNYSDEKNNNDQNTLNSNYKSNANQDYANFSFLPPRKIPKETDLDLQLICIHDGEKIYKLSDLFVPKDEKIIKKIERYNNKIMSISEKEKYEKENEGQKKEVNETEEIKQIIKKAKRNQKFTRINITYDEKFFDRTHFLENIHASALAHQEIVLQENQELVKKQILQEGLLKSYRIANEKKIEDEIIERNLLNALFYIKVKLSEEEQKIKDINKNEFEEIEDNYLIGCDYNFNKDLEENEMINIKAFDNNLKTNSNKIISEIVKKNKEDKGDLLSYKNTNFSDLSFSHTINENNNKRLLLSQNFQIDPNEYDQIIKIESKIDNKRIINNENDFVKNSIDFNKQYLQTEPLKALQINNEEEKTLFDNKFSKTSFEEFEILKLNLLIKENVEKNMKFDPEDFKHDKNLLATSNKLIINQGENNLTNTDHNNTNFKDNNNNNQNNLSNEIINKERNFLNAHSSENDQCEESHNNLMDLDYVNQSNNFNNSNIKMEMDFENLNNFSFQNKKIDFTNSYNKNLSKTDDKSSNLINNNNNILTNNIQKIPNFVEFSNQKSNNENLRNKNPNGESLANINGTNNFNNVESENAELKNKTFNSNVENKDGMISNKNKKEFSSANKTKFSNLSNDGYHNENEDFDNNYDEISEENEDEENENSDDYRDKDNIPPEDIFETKEFKIFNLQESKLLKSTFEENNKKLISTENDDDNNFKENIHEINDDLVAKNLDFQFNKPFPNAVKEKNFLLSQNEDLSMLNRKPLKSSNLNNIKESLALNWNLNNIHSANDLNVYSASLNNLNDLHSIDLKNSILNNNTLQNENILIEKKSENLEREFLGIKKERDLADNYDLFNKSKCLKHKKQAFYNEYLLTGEYLPAIILSEEDLKNSKHKYYEVSKKIFDLNDYNMNFEILKADSLTNSKFNKEKDREIGKDISEGKEAIERKESIVALDLGTGLPQTKAEMSLRDAELITEPLPILPLNEEIPKQNLVILGLNNNAANKESTAKAELNAIASNKEAITIFNNNINNIFNNTNLINSSNNNACLPEDFFATLQSKLNSNSNFNANNNFLKIGKAKGNLLTHAKCSYNLTYNKINLTYDDLRDFHRPNFCKFLLREKKKKNFSFLISEKYNISKGDKIKRWDCAILTRNFLKKQEKKRISKNIQYMNAYEIFKDRHKLSLNDGKYALFEHIDEYPLFVSNFGMASKLKKFLYTPKLFNVNVANPNTKLNDVELKTYNVTGPYGSQILLQPNQKLPLVGQIDLNELKGMSVLDNKMYRAPVFYEKFKNPILLKPKGGSSNINNNDDNNQDEVVKDRKGNENNGNNNEIGNKNNLTNNKSSNKNINNLDNSTAINSQSHHTKRRNVLSINLNNNSNSNINKNKNRAEAEKDTNNKNLNTNINNNNNINSSINTNNPNDPKAKKPSNLINLGNNISIDPSNIEIVEGKDGKKYYNFLLTFRKNKEGKESFTIREIEHAYTVAQEEPKIEVYPPQSRQYNNFLKKKIQTYTYKLYDEIGYKRGINFKEFTNLFPNVTEQILKKNFREMNIEIDKNICFFSKIPSEDNHMLITPENICQFESCQFGIYKLREVGIKNITNPDKISYATNKFINQTPDPKQQFLGRVTEEELLTTPWNITQNFLQAKQIKGMLAIKGIGDPSNGQGGYSFLKMPVKNYNDNKTLKEEIDILKNANKNIKTVTGTDADLRKLSKDDIKMKLIQLGQDEEIINKLSRWERVSLLRYRSSQAAQMVFFNIFCFINFCDFNFFYIYNLYK